MGQPALQAAGKPPVRIADEVHEAGRAWAQHELGTLHLAAGDTATAGRLLERARETRRRLGDEEGLAATEQSLGVLCRRQAGAVGLIATTDWSFSSGP